MENFVNFLFLIIGLMQVPLGIACLWSCFKGGNGFTGFGNTSTFNISSTNTQINH